MASGTINSVLSELLINKATAVTAENYDNLPSGLFYNQGVGTNCPTATGYLLVFTLHIPVGAAFQLAFDMSPPDSGSRFYFRARTSSVWRAWKLAYGQNIEALGVTKSAANADSICNCQKVGNLIIASFYISNSSAMAKNDTIFTLPSGYTASGTFWANAVSDLGTTNYRVAIANGTGIIKADNAFPNRANVFGQIVFPINV